ncbi:hypothetical protein JQ604_16280 [Bradyrhizobium jicamae]|uniref:hypothetical protein n=1 Tax=Bradyrhizobium jicamae TaxID=280332 RepID=UPI001BA55361|nr:hypothetical protein [Bradyrhizobium jicamae]MBR0753746.1 hypothetical protein [Bradyrhizobium jicamae]
MESRADQLVRRLRTERRTVEPVGDGSDADAAHILATAVEFLIEKTTTLSSAAATDAHMEIREYRIEDVAFAAWPP